MIWLERTFLVAALAVSFLLGIVWSQAQWEGFLAEAYPVYQDCRTQTRHLWRLFEHLKERQDEVELQWASEKDSQPGIPRGAKQQSMLWEDLNLPSDKSSWNAQGTATPPQLED